VEPGTGSIVRGAIEAEAQGEAMTAVNGAYLRQALKALGAMAELKVKDPQSPMLFSIDGYRIVVMPMAIGIGKKDSEGKPEAVAEAEEIVEVETEDKPKRPSVRRTKAKEPVAVA